MRATARRLPLCQTVALQSGLTHTVRLPERFRGSCPFGAADRCEHRANGLSRVRMNSRYSRYQRGVFRRVCAARMCSMSPRDAQAVALRLSRRWVSSSEEDMAATADAEA